MKKGFDWIDNAFIYGSFVCLCITEDDFKRQCKKLKVPAESIPGWINKGANATTHTMENEEGRLCSIVCIEQRKDFGPEQIIGLLVHEAVHVWQEFSDSIGEEKPSPEFEAYSIQAISQRLVTSYKELTKSKKK